MKTFRIFLLLATVGLLVPNFSFSQNNKDQVGYDFLAAMDANDLVAYKKCVTADYRVFHPNFPNPLTAEEHFEMGVKPFNAAFEHFTHKVLDSNGDGQKFCMRGIVTGKHVGELMGIPASNNEISVPWLAFATLNEDGKIKELHVQFNQLSFLAQIGANPLAKN